jgi:hypothetical protein
MTLTAEVQKFEGFLKTLELKFFKGKLHQKILAPHPGQEPSHAWVPIDSHDVEAPAPGEPIVAAAAAETKSDLTPPDPPKAPPEKTSSSAKSTT